MANHKSAVKANRQSKQARLRNRAHRSRLRSQIKKLRKALEDGSSDDARALLTPTLSMLDHSVSLGVVHQNKAARTKSRLTRHVARVSAGA